MRKKLLLDNIDHLEKTAKLNDEEDLRHYLRDQTSTKIYYKTEKPDWKLLDSLGHVKDLNEKERIERLAESKM